MSVITVPAESLLATAVSPESLREMSPSELRSLVGEIRRFLISSVSATGGHLGSNLGVVELTVALHRVFSSPDDAIVWDTGHQAYVHKLVTGRQEGFARLRQGGGMSGYPNRSESEHDIVENSHASTALSYAYGLATARRLRRDLRHVVAVVGDGALTGGVAYEALNNIGVSGANVVIVLNDNGRSYAPTVSRISSAGGSSAPGPATSSPAPRPSATKDFFEALGVRYLGPVDGHDLDALERTLQGVARLPGPVVLHVHTTKGRGYGPAELDEEKRLHDVGPFDPETGIALAAARGRLSYTEAFSSAIVREAARRPEIVAITAAMPGPTGLLEFRERFPERFFDVGIAEQHAVNAAAGMAMGGLRPVVAIYSTFLNRAWDQVYYDVGLHRLPVVFCLDRAGITGDDGPSHHGVLDLMLLTKVPGMTVFAPSSYAEVGNMLHEALAITSGPVAIRWPKSAACPSELVGSGIRAREGARRISGLPHRGRQAGRGLRTRRLHPWQRGHQRHGLGRARSFPSGSGHDRRCVNPCARRVRRGRDPRGRRWPPAQRSTSRSGSSRTPPGGRQLRRTYCLPSSRRGGRHPRLPRSRWSGDQPGGARPPVSRGPGSSARGPCPQHRLHACLPGTEALA